VEPPLVSVVVPVHQGEAFLGEAIDSALAQTLEGLEVIVVDDGSTDGSLAVARSRERDPRVRVLSTPHGGVSAARNEAIAVARGRYTAFLDADDVWERDYLRAQVDALEAHPDRFVYADGVRFGEGPDRPFFRPGYAGGAGFRELFEGGHVATPSAVVVRTDAVRAAGGFPVVEGPFLEDVALWLALCARGVAPLYNPRARIRYRLHPAQLTREWVRHNRGKLAVRLRFRDATAGDPPRRLISEADADAVLARIGLDLAVALASSDPAEAARVAREARARDPGVRADPRWRKWRRKAFRARVRRLPLVGALLRRLRGR
jgi:glycosyltransferase involved in cell wall biosynthesis